MSKNKNLKVTGVFFGEGTSELPEIIKKHNIKYKILINDDNFLKKKLKKGAFPMNYLVNNKNVIIYSSLGNLASFEEEISNRIKI